MQGPEERGKEFAETFSSFVNTMGGKLTIEAAIEVMMRDHPTLQQGMMRFVIAFIKALADVRSDGRNECAVKLATKIMAALDYEDEFLPTI